MKRIGSKRLLLDTNAVIDYFKGNALVVARIKAAKVIFLPVITLGELYFGANNSAKKDKHTKQVKKFYALCELLGVDAETARIYGIIKAELKKMGRPIPENDIWIAAISKQHKITLLSNDNHFKSVRGIKLAGW